MLKANESAKIFATYISLLLAGLFIALTYSALVVDKDVFADSHSEDSGIGDIVGPIIGDVIDNTEGNPLEKACEDGGSNSSYCEQIENDQLFENVCDEVGGSLGDLAPEDCEVNPFVNILRIALSIITAIAAALAVIFFILGAIRYSASRGSPDGIAGAKKMIIYAVIGLLLTIFAGSIVAFFLEAAVDTNVTTDDGGDGDPPEDGGGSPNPPAPNPPAPNPPAPNPPAPNPPAPNPPAPNPPAPNPPGGDPPPPVDEEPIPNKIFTVTSGNFGFLIGENFIDENPLMIVDPGDIVRIILTSNSGTHNWVVDEIPNASTNSVSPGEAAVEITFVVPSSLAGQTISYYSSVSNDRELGMEGQFEISNNL